MGIGYLAKLARDSECHQKVLRRNQPLLLIFQPALGFEVLAMWTQAVATGVRNQRLVFTFGTTRQHLATVLCSASTHRAQGPLMGRQEPVSVSLLQSGLKLINN